MRTKYIFRFFFLSIALFGYLSLYTQTTSTWTLHGFLFFLFHPSYNLLAIFWLLSPWWKLYWIVIVFSFIVHVYVGVTYPENRCFLCKMYNIAIFTFFVFLGPGATIVFFAEHPAVIMFFICLCLSICVPWEKI